MELVQIAPGGKVGVTIEINDDLLSAMCEEGGPGSTHTLELRHDKTGSLALARWQVTCLVGGRVRVSPHPVQPLVAEWPKDTY